MDKPTRVFLNVCTTPNAMSDDEFKSIMLKEIKEIKALIAKNNHKRIGGIELAVEVTGYKTATIYQMVMNERIPYKKVNSGKLVFSEEKLREWLYPKEVAEWAG